MLKSIVKKILSSKLFKCMGMSLVNYDLLKYTKHYLWILNLKKVPNLKMFYRSPKPVTEADVRLCLRLTEAYLRSTRDEKKVEEQTSELWSKTLKQHSRKLKTALHAADARELAAVLSCMFREEFVFGLASGHLFDHSLSRFGSKIWSLKYQDNLVALAEYLGIVRTESTQQGEVCFALREGMETLAGRIQESIGISLDFPDIGAAYGIMAGKSLVTMEAPEHLYAALRVSQAVKDYGVERNSGKLNVVEIGAGFGGLAYWLIMLNRFAVKTYTIIDLPLVNLIQGYFLAKVFGADRVLLFGEPEKEGVLFRVMPTFSADNMKAKDIDVLINENSMPEMNEQIVDHYLKFAKRCLKGIFFSYNHEAHSFVFGKLQVLVPQAVKRVGGFERLSRNASWLRSGYIEEVYRLKGEQ